MGRRSQGRTPFPRLELHPDLIAAIEAARLSGRRLRTIALLADFATLQNFSNQLHAGRVTATRMSVIRWGRVAEAVYYNGPIFVGRTEVAR